MQTSPLPPVQPAADPAARAAARKAGEEFEAMALAELLKPMFEALDADGLGGGGAGERMFRPMLVEHYAKAMAARGGVGLAEAVSRELLALQSRARP